jgi:hypothetical protein
MASSLDSGALIYRNYGDFRGLDFSNRKDEVSLNRSPDALNMWKNYKNNAGNCIETRPGTVGKVVYDYTVYGMNIYNGKMIVHSGKNLWEDDKIIFEGMAEHRSNFFIYKKNLYIKDGANYLVYDGKECKPVEGYIPTTTIGRNPAGGGTVYEDVNFLTGKRKNQFLADGEATEYHLDVESFDSDFIPIITVNDKNVTDFTAYFDKGYIKFNKAPDAPATVGQDNVIIQFKKTVEGYRERIEKCTLLEEFDNRIFFSGNPDYPNMLYHCALENPEYCRDLDYYTEGVDDSSIKALVSGNNALWVMKEPSQTNTTIFYHNPTIDDTEGKIYPSTHSSISTGCVSTGINFFDDIVFFSERGMEAISGDVTTEQVLAHRSTLIDNKLLNEANYKDMILEKWQGYLLVIIDNKIYLADSRTMVTMNNHAEYEWFYLELDEKITSTYVKDEVLYLCSGRSVVTLTNTSEDREVNSYWTTIADEYGYPHVYKMNSKKSYVIDGTGTEIKIEIKKDYNEFTTVGTFSTKNKNIEKYYFKAKVKAKKYKSLQHKFSSTKPFSLVSFTAEAYLGSVVKR